MQHLTTPWRIDQQAMSTLTVNQNDQATMQQPHMTEQRFDQPAIAMVTL